MSSRFLFKLGQLLQEHFAPAAAAHAATADAPTSLSVPPTQVEQLRLCLINRRDYFDDKSDHNKWWAGAYELLTVIFSVSTPVVIGWQGLVESDSKPFFIKLALIISALTAGITTLTNFFDNKELWVQYKVARNELDALLTRLNMLAADGQPAITVAQLEQIFVRYEQICTETDAFYRRTRLAPNPPAPPVK